MAVETRMASLAGGVGEGWGGEIAAAQHSTAVSFLWTDDPLPF